MAIYVAQVPSGAFKVGFSTWPARRIRDLRLGGERPELLVTFEAVRGCDEQTDRNAEREIHRSLRAYAIDGANEWYGGLPHDALDLFRDAAARSLQRDRERRLRSALHACVSLDDVQRAALGRVLSNWSGSSDGRGFREVATASLGLEA